MHTAVKPTQTDVCDTVFYVDFFCCFGRYPECYYSQRKNYHNCDIVCFPANAHP